MATVAIAATACSGTTSGPSSDATSDPAPTTTRERPRVPAEPSAQVLREQRVYANPAPLGAVQERHGVAPVILDPGEYTFDELGVELTVSLPDYWRLDGAEPGRIAFTRPDAELASLLPGMDFLRPIGFADPLRAGTHTLHPGSSGWEQWDLAAWIEAVPSIVVLDQGRLTVDGRDAQWWDIDVDPTRGRTNESCEPGSCVDMMWTGGAYTMVARDLERIRWYEIPDPLGQIVVLVAGRDAEWAELVTDADEIVRSVVLGESAPHPLSAGIVAAERIDLAANTEWTFSGLGGVTFTSPTTVSVGQRPGELVHFVRDDLSTIGFVVPETDAASVPISSVADIVAALERHDGTTILDRDADLLGEPAIVADIEFGQRPTLDDALLLLSDTRPGYAPVDAAWPTMPHNRVWVLDTPVGPALVTAAGVSPELLDHAVDRLDFFTAALGFCPATDSCGAQR